MTAGAEAGAWETDDARFSTAVLFCGMHGIVDDAYLKEKRIARRRLVGRLQRVCFRTVGWRSDDVI